MLYPVFFVAVFLGHWTLLRLPYFWDEGGYYIPAAWDVFTTGSLIPHSTLSNAHPPLPSLLLAGWWHLSGFVVSGTRTLVCLVAAAALLAVFRLGKRLSGSHAGAVTAVLTAIYPIWYAQSTLAHADIFAACFTLWALSCYLAPADGDCGGIADRAWAAVLFSCAALSKETAIVTPVALAGLELFHGLRRQGSARRAAWSWAATLAAPLLPLLAWYAFHYARTGFVFGNPEFLRYNATANLSLARLALSLWHRLLHLVGHMNLYVATLCGIAALLMPVRPRQERHVLPRRATERILFVLVVNWVEFSVLGGALLSRYLLPMYPLLLLLWVSAWLTRMPWWPAVAGLTATAFLAGIWINPPYAFAPEDNLTYRDMIVLHQQAISVVAHRFPQATVLTAWPASAELERPMLGYVRTPIKVFEIRNFSAEEMGRAAAEPGDYDTALLFSTKWEPAQGQLDLSRGHRASDERFFDFHHDLRPEEAARLLHGDVVWQAQRGAEWAAVLHFPRITTARLQASGTVAGTSLSPSAGPPASKP